MYKRQPLWNTWLDGLQEEAPEGEEIDVAGLKAIFAKALEELEDMSGAKVGDKTMMDALIPASEAVAAYTGDSADELFDAAAQAAAQGAEATKQYVSKFGRAKSYGTKTIGTPDAGAVSMSWFFPVSYTHLDVYKRQVLDRVGYQHVRLDRNTRTVTFDLSGIGLDPGAAGKGFALGLTVDRLRQGGVRQAVLDYGGNLFVIGAPQDPQGGTRPWKVAIRDPDNTGLSLIHIL